MYPSSMKKRPFVLIEVLIAVALLTLCAIPLIADPLFAHRKMAKKLFELEQEREAEKIYFAVLQKELSMKNITREQNVITPLNSVEITIDGLGKKAYPNAHYHLYHCRQKTTTGPFYNIHLRICFDDSEKGDKYSFNFVGKVVDQKDKNLHGEEKTSDPKDERLFNDIQTLRQGE